MEPDQLRGILADTAHKLKRNKALVSGSLLRLVALDGHELFSLASPPL
jgi:hypothetical protein